MDKLVKYLVDSILKENTNIKKIVGVYGGRFQPFGPHHYKTYKWLTKQVDDAYISTSNIKKLPRHPMNFKEKVRHMSKMGVPSNKIIEEKTPYVAKNLEKKYDKDTTAFVYVFGAKDAGRLGGRGKYYKDYLKNKKDLKGYDEHGYYLVAPHVSIRVGGQEVSGTSMRDLLGSDKFEDKEREKLFKKMFGYYDKGVFNMMRNKFTKLFESINLKEGVSSSQLNQVETYLDKLWGKVGIDVEFTRHFMDRANDKRNEKPINSAEVLRLFKQTYKKYGKQIPKLGKGAQALMKDMKTDVNVPFALHWNGKELELRAKTIMRKKNFKSSNKKFAVEGKLEESKKEFVIWGIAPNKSSEEILYTKAKSQGEAKKVVKVLTDKHGIKKARIQILDLEQDPSKFWNSQDMYEGVDLPIEIGDTVRMGKFKNKKVVIKTIDWNEKGDLLINGRPALKFRIIQSEVIDNFLTTIDMKSIIEESNSISSAGGVSHVDDGTRYFYGNMKSYKKASVRRAKKIGWEVISYLMPDTQEIFDHNTEYPNGSIGPISYLPSGNLSAGSERADREIFVGSRGFRKYYKHIMKCAELLGYKLISFMDAGKHVRKTDTKDLKSMADEEPKLQYPKNSQQHDDMETVKEALFSSGWWKAELLKEELVTKTQLQPREKELLLMGGAYGHMAHPFDDKDLTFGDLKKIITLGLGGQLNREDGVTEKLDGQNIMVSWKDGKLIAARNKGHIKNGGKTALDKNGIASKFKGRGSIRNAFVYAMNDLEKAIKSLSEKQRTKIFNNGYNFMNLEVMYPSSANVIDYDITQLVFHGALIYDDSGNVKGEVKGSGRILQGMIKQRNQNIQKKYSIGKPVFLDVPKHQDFGKMKDKFLGRLSRLQHEYGLKENDTLALYHQMWWEHKIYQTYGSKNLSGKLVQGLVKRWAFFDKSYSVADIKKDMKRFIEANPKKKNITQEILDFDKKNHAAQVKENMKPFEELFFGVGAEILKNVKGFISANPKKSVRNMVKNLDKAIKIVKSGGDLKKLKTLKLQLDKLNAIGGTKAIVPSEGLVFKYKGKTYKFTGAFAPINQITGLIYF